MVKLVLSRVGESLVGFAPDQASADAARRLWESGAGRAEVMRAWPFFGSAALADALERGDEVEAGWLAAYENPGRLEPLDRLHGFVELAMWEPQVRRLGAGIRLGVRGLSFRDLEGVYVDGGRDPNEEVWTLLREIERRRVVGLYPELFAGADSVQAVWQGELTRQGLPYNVLPAGVNANCKAVAECGERRATLGLGAWERRISVGLRDAGAGVTWGRVPDLTTAATVAGRWLGGARRAEVAREWPFLGSVALAEAVERGDEREARWLRLYETRHEDWRAVRVADFIELAFEEPGLRSRLAGFSHWMLHFREPGRPILAIEPTVTRGHYRVLIDMRRPLGEGDAATALRLMRAELNG